jgi:hypothetical protein
VKRMHVHVAVSDLAVTKEYGDGTGEREARVAHAKACRVPPASAAAATASACCK